MISRQSIAFLFLLACYHTVSFAASSRNPVEFYKSNVEPLLATRCFTCHTDAEMGGLRLDSRERVLKGGQSGPAIIPGRPDQSLLIQAVSHTHPQLKMPPQGKLTKREVAVLRTWIETGAHFEKSADLEPQDQDSAGAKERSSFWAFQPIQRPSLPYVNNGEWPRQPIDYFILSRLEENDLKPAKPANRRILLRRVTYDLIGLPPTPEQYREFLEDESPDPFERVVDRLLASPRYGEAWARHWLDVARYADEDALGLQAEPFPNAFRYRNWVTDAFNRDMPYDLFVKAQIAGDLLEDETETRLKPGLGLFALGPWYYKIVEPPKARADELHDRLDVLSRGFLGLTVACARCHDHKYDPISTKDYYALGGIFTSTKYEEYPLADPEVVEEYDRHKERIDALEAKVKDFLHEQAEHLGEQLALETSHYLSAAWRVVVTEESVAEIAQKQGLHAETLERWCEYLAKPTREHPFLDWWNELDSTSDYVDVRTKANEFQQFLDRLVEEQKEIESYNKKVIEESKKSTDPYDIFCKGCNAETKSLSRDKYMLWTDLFEPEHETNGRKKVSGVLYYGPDQIGHYLSRSSKTKLTHMQSELEFLQENLPERYPFLHIIADKEKPQDMRQHIRGDPYSLGDMIPRDFLSVLGHLDTINTGNSGRLQLAEAIASPQNPLTARVIVNRIWYHLVGQGLVSTLSNFGKVGDRPSHPQLLDYLANRLIELDWSIKKLQREILLSSTYRMSSSQFSTKHFKIDPENRLLWKANRRRLSAEEIRDSMLYLTGELNLEKGRRPFAWNGDGERYRRTLYGNVSRFRLEPYLSLFDFPAPTITSERREVTNTPLQRLFFLNSDFIVQRSEHLVNLLRMQRGGFESRIRFVYDLMFGREPREAEVALAREFIPETDNTQAWCDYIQSLLSSNQFIFID